MTLPKNKAKLIRILSLVLLGALIGAILGKTVSGINSPYLLGSKEKIIFSVEKGQGFFEIAARLEKESLIKNRLSFDAAVFLIN